MMSNSLLDCLSWSSMNPRGQLSIRPVSSSTLTGISEEHSHPAPFALREEKYILNFSCPISNRSSSNAWIIRPTIRSLCVSTRNHFPELA